MHQVQRNSVHHQHLLHKHKFFYGHSNPIRTAGLRTGQGLHQGSDQPGSLAVDFTTTTPTHYLLQHAPLTEARYSIEATLPSAQACLVLTRCTAS